MTAAQECKQAYDNFERVRNFSKTIPNCIWDIDIELPEPPAKYKEIENYGKSKEDRTFPYYNSTYIKQIDSLPNSDPEKKAFLDKEWERRRNGLWFYNGDNLEWVTGHYYMTLQYWMIPIEDLDGGFGNPKFVDLHRDIAYAIWWGKNHPDHTGLIYLGTRRSGKSVLGISHGYWDTTERYNALFGIQSKTDTDSKGLLLKLVGSWQRLPSFWKPVDTGYTTVSRELMFAEPQRKSSKGKKREYREVLNSRIYAYPSTETAMDGMRTTFQFQDECFSPHTLVSMADGSVKAIKDIRLGEQVMGADGKPSEVIDLFNGVDEMFRVESKFGHFDCNSNHKITCYYSLRKGRTKINGKWYSYGEPIDITPQEYLSLSEYKRRHLMLKKAACNYESKPVNIEPYTLGVWLGDGTSNNGNITTEDTEVIDAISKHYKTTNKIKSYSKAENKPLFCCKVEGIREKLVNYNLIKNKHIPKKYLHNDTETRLKLLAGILDSDGYTNDKYFEVTQKNKELAYDIYNLSSSLGFNTTIKDKVARMKREDGSVYECTVYRVSIYGDIDKIPNKIDRKKAKPKRAKNRRSPDKSSFSVTPIGQGEYVGIQLDRNPYFLLSNGVIVHNCGKRTDSDAYKTQQISKICCVVGRKVVGFAFWATTVEEMEKGGGEAAQKIWEASNPRKLNANGRTTSTMVRLFFPAEYGLFEGGFIDQWGYSDLNAAREWLDSEEKGLDGEDLTDWKRKFPRKLDDCFAVIQNTNRYNKRKLYEQYMYSSTLDPIAEPVRGNFMWENGIQDGNVIFKPNDDGKWLVAWMPPEEDRNKKERFAGHWKPTRDHCKTGADPFAHRSTTEKGSMGAAYTLLEHHYKYPQMKMAWVCQYLARTNHPHEQAEDMIMQCVFYSSDFLCEKNVYGVLDYFHKRGYDGYCLFNPLDDDSVKKRIKGHRGMPMTGADAGEALSNITQAHIEDYIGYNEENRSHGFCPFLELISDWQKFDPNKRTAFDCAMAAGMTLIATKKPKHKVEVTYNVSDWLPKYNNAGNTSRRVR